MTLEPALAKAREELREANPRLIAARSGATWEERCPERVEGSGSPLPSERSPSTGSGWLKLPFFNRRFAISFPEGEVIEGSPGHPSPGEGPPPWLEVMILHYLLGARGYPLADRWVPYRDLPGANVFGVGFGEGPLRELAAAFGRDPEGFHRAGQALGGAFMDRFGDAAYRFLAFPKIALAVILYLADEEMPASATLLYDAGCAQHLPTEDLQVLGGYLNNALRHLARNPVGERFSPYAAPPTEWTGPPVADASGTEEAKG